MAKKSYYYKFLIKVDKKILTSEINSIKRAIQRILIDVPIGNIYGGVANNKGYYKFRTEGDKVGSSA